jgi:hypothetical protein
MDEQTARLLRIVGGVVAAIGIALFFIAAGFPPGFTTTYHSTATGVTQTTSPGFGEVAAYLGVILLGLALMRAAEVKR